MSEIDELLDELEESMGAGMGSSEEHIVIGRDRYIVVPEALKKIGVQYDHNIETVTFDCPRYWDGIDMTENMIAYVNYMREDGRVGSHICGRPTPDDTDDDVMHFDWTVSRNVTEVKGSLAFLVCIKKADENGIEINHWNSELNRDMFVSEGLEANPWDDPQTVETVTQLLIQMETVKAEFAEFKSTVQNDISEFKDTVNARVGEFETDVNSRVSDFVAEVDYANTQFQGEVNQEVARLRELVEEVDHAVTADRATADADGNVIKDTYAKISDLQSGVCIVDRSNSTAMAEEADLADRAFADVYGNPISDTYAKKAELESGAQTVLHATHAGEADNAYNDASGNNIMDTYATKDELIEQVEMISDGHTVVYSANWLNDKESTWTGLNDYSIQIKHDQVYADRVHVWKKNSLTLNFIEVVYDDGANLWISYSQLSGVDVAGQSTVYCEPGEISSTRLQGYLTTYDGAPAIVFYGMYNQNLPDEIKNAIIGKCGSAVKFTAEVKVNRAISADSAKTAKFLTGQVVYSRTFTDAESSIEVLDDCEGVFEPNATYAMQFIDAFGHQWYSTTFVAPPSYKMPTATGTAGNDYLNQYNVLLNAWNKSDGTVELTKLLLYYEKQSDGSQAFRVKLVNFQTMRQRCTIRFTKLSEPLPTA